MTRRPERPLCSVVSVGEALHIASRKRNEWGATKRERLRELLANLVVVQLGFGDVVDQYARLGALSDAAGRHMDSNDLWIAATTVATKAILITTDTDFDALHPTELERVFIDPATLPRGP